MNKLSNFYAVPVLAAAPVVQFGEGDFCYQGMRGLAGLGQAPPSMSDPTMESLKKVLPWVAGAAMLGLVGWAALR